MFYRLFPTLRYLLSIVLLSLFLGSCLKSGSKTKAPPPPALSLESQTPPVAPSEPRCALPKTAQQFRLSPPSGVTPSAPDFRQIQGAIDTACQSCHKAPGTKVGGFHYAPSYADSELVVEGSTQIVPGLAAQAERMRDALLNGSMPPANIRDQNPEAYLKLGRDIDAWIAAGKPEEGPKQDKGPSDDYPANWGPLDGQQLSDLGNCLPAPETVGTDPETDYLFAESSEIPARLSETDLDTMDSTKLAARGTISYNIEYPLWNDHAKKMRHIHLPSTIKDGRSFKPKALEVVQPDRNSEAAFNIPENTRFYKTFFRGVKEQDGSIRYIPVETRLIVVRFPPRKPLYGTYVWRADGTDADRLTTPYRDGSAWKDLTLSLDFNRQTGSKRNYLVPARHRCEQCHTGGNADSFVLGFTPLQVNRRNLGEAGRDLPVESDELNQVSRLVSYGVLSPQHAAQLPKLEYFPSNRQLDEHTLRAQGYILGNCQSCHNPKGYAKIEANIPMDFSAGRLFNFDTNLTSTYFQNRKLVNHEGKLEQSYLFHRVAGSDQELKLEARMPLHSAAAPDCRAVRLMARWIKTYDKSLSAYDLDRFEAPQACTSDDNYDLPDFSVLEQDPTDTAGPYKPRREDWNDPVSGMPMPYYDLRFTAPLVRIARLSYAVDWWVEKPECKFPPSTIAASEIKAWMKKPDGTPTKPLDQLYWTTPGAYFYNLTCVKCHGRVGEADGALAQNLDKWSGGTIRVANFRKGLFGEQEKNLEQFSRLDPAGAPVDYSGNYFIWMALEGTKMNPPPQVADLLGTNKAQMLKTIMDRCARQIPSNPKAAKPFFRDYDLFNEVCTHDNLPVTDPKLAFDPETGKALDPLAQDVWLKKAAANAGWMIYDYVRSTLAKGKQQFPQTECENVFAP